MFSTYKTTFLTENTESIKIKSTINNYFIIKSLMIIIHSLIIIILVIIFLYK